MATETATTRNSPTTCLLPFVIVSPSESSYRNPNNIANIQNTSATWTPPCFLRWTVTPTATIRRSEYGKMMSFGFCSLTLEFRCADVTNDADSCNVCCMNSARKDTSITNVCQSS